VPELPAPIPFFDSVWLPVSITGVLANGLPGKPEQIRSFWMPGFRLTDFQH